MQCHQAPFTCVSTRATAVSEPLPGSWQPGRRVFQMQSSSRRGFVSEGELQPNPNPRSPGKNRGLQGAVPRAQPPASVRGRLRAGLATRCGQATGRPRALGRPMQTPSWSKLGEAPCGALWGGVSRAPSPPALLQAPLIAQPSRLSSISWSWCHR